MLLAWKHSGVHGIIIKIYNVTILRVKNAKFGRVILGDKLNWKNHINYI